MKSFFETFELTVAQQRTIIVLLLAFVAVIAANSYRARAREQRQAPPIVQPSPSPGTRP